MDFRKLVILPFLQLISPLRISLADTNYKKKLFGHYGLNVTAISNLFIVQHNNIFNHVKSANNHTCLGKHDL